MKTKNKIVIGFVGKICSGKDVAAAYLVKKYKGDVVMFSQSLRDALARFYKPTTRENMQKISLAVRQTLGQDILSKTVSEDVKKSKKRMVVVNGIRRVEDIQELSKVKGFAFIHLTAPAELRFKRLRARGQNPGEAKLTWKKFEVEDNAETEQTIAAAAKKADYEIDNSGSFKDFYKKLDAIVSKIK